MGHRLFDMNRSLITVQRRVCRMHVTVARASALGAWAAAECGAANAAVSLLQTRTDRLADYFALVGIEDKLISIEDESRGGVSPGAVRYAPEDTAFKGSVLSRYPVELEFDDTPFPQGIVLFCFPNGIRLLKPPPVGDPLPTFFTFVATGTAGSQLYGHCLTFYEPITPQQLECVDTRNGTPIVESPPSASAAKSKPARPPYFAPKCLVIMSHWCFPEFRDVLTELYRLSLSESAVPLERIVCNFMSEVPLPPAGKVAVQYVIGSADVTFQRAPLNKRLSPIGLQFQDVFECLSVPNIELIFRCLLTERQVCAVLCCGALWGDTFLFFFLFFFVLLQIVFHSTQLSLLTAAAEVCAAILYPFHWPHVYIPVLPQGLLQVLQAPMPFILGVPAIVMLYIRNLADSVVTVDLDHNIVDVHEEMPVAELPPSIAAKLTRRLQKYADVYSHRPRSWAMTVLPNKDVAFRNAARPYEADDDAEVFVPDWEKTRVAFFKATATMFAQYRKYMSFGPRSGGGGGGITGSGRGEDKFDRAEFLKAVPHEYEPFLSAVLATQAFTNFVDERVRADNAGSPEVLFFDSFLEEKANRARLFGKATASFYNSEEHEITKTQVALAPDTDGIPPDAVYKYYPFPVLDASLYAEPRPVPSFADDTMSVLQSGLSRPYEAIFFDAAKFVDSFDSTVYSCWFLVTTATIATAGPAHSGKAETEATAAGGGKHGRKARGMSRSKADSFLASDEANFNYKQVSAVQHGVCEWVFLLRVVIPWACRLPCVCVFVGWGTVPLSLFSTCAFALCCLQLRVVLAVLYLMQRNGVEPDEIVYRCAMEAAARCGSSATAVTIMKQALKAHVHPDISFFSGLLRAFSMDPAATSAGSSRVMEMSKLLPSHPHGHDSKADGAGAGSAGAAGKGITIMPALLQRLTLSHPTITAPAAPTPAQYARLQRIRSTIGHASGGKRGGIGSSGLWDTGSAATSNAPSPQPSMHSSGPTTPAGAMASAVKGLFSGFSKPKLFGGNKKSSNAPTPVAADPPRSPLFGAAPDASPTSSPMLGDDSLLDDKWVDEAVVADIVRSPAGFGPLLPRFPGLAIDTTAQVCPEPTCAQVLSDSDIQSGWMKNPSEYTTVCPYCNAREVAERHGALLRVSLDNFDTPDLFVATRFVPRFSITCAAPDWEGSTGASSPPPSCGCASFMLWSSLPFS